MQAVAPASMQAGKIVARRYAQRIGNTPLLDLSRFSANPKVQIFGKAEFTNPSLSVKDRMLTFIIEKAVREEKLKRGDTIVAASSGNTAAALAMYAGLLGFKSVIITNEKCSVEKKNVLGAYGAELMVTPSGVPIDSPMHYQNVEIDLCEKNDTYWSLNQYDNPDNRMAYYYTLGPEIWQDTNGNVTHFVAAASTGGTISGTTKYLKERRQNIRGVMPDPYGSIFHEYWKNGNVIKPGKFQVEGIGKDSIPEAMDFGVVDDVIQFHDKDAFEMCHTLAREEGVLVGGSAGANVWASVELSKKIDSGCIVTVLCDSGVKYLSKIFNEDWLAEKVPDFDMQKFHMAPPVWYSP